MSFEWDASSDTFKEDELQDLRGNAWQALYTIKQRSDSAAGEQGGALGKQDGAIKIGQRPANLYRWFIAAAVILLLVGAGGIYKFIIPAGKPVNTGNTAFRQPDVLPGGRKATLQMANGSVVTLDSLQTANLNEKDGTQIQKKGGELVYHGAISKEEGITGRQEAALYNTLSTPRGGEYQLVLPDGSKVWLNAASSLRFPTRFADNERTVYLTGEAYFDIKKNPKQPFRVNVVSGSGRGKDMQVEVLGTQFCVNAYTDEQTINTTLVEGAVKVNGAEKSILLSPGEQAQLEAGSNLQNNLRNNLRVLKDVNIDEIIAWKEGNFHFESADLTVILRQFARWYDIDLVYEGNLKPRKFFGIISRSSTLASVLNLLKANDINFRIEGKKLIVQAK